MGSCTVSPYGKTSVHRIPGGTTAPLPQGRSALEGLEPGVPGDCASSVKAAHEPRPLRLQGNLTRAGARRGGRCPASGRGKQGSRTGTAAPGNRAGETRAPGTPPLKQRSTSAGVMRPRGCGQWRRGLGDGEIAQVVSVELPLGRHSVCCELCRSRCEQQTGMLGQKTSISLHCIDVTRLALGVGVVLALKGVALQRSKTLESCLGDVVPMFVVLIQDINARNSRGDTFRFQKLFVSVRLFSCI
ncbi:hypothetical protein NDU88_001017 [Pleurodeles waltl]|uniref:Uncharacterized protein n=1 Tax=Pleurodeles waltl TaxID=8319 RepID=A0AAV7LBC6_PLEWA|nr:hypothetical protein NDU88_001017 [Pleurodeles waltl]